jgi:hypothetical protein
MSRDSHRTANSRGPGHRPALSQRKNAATQGQENRLRRSRRWLVGVLGSALAVALATAITWLFIHSGNAVIDRVRSGPALVATSDVIVDSSQGYAMVLPSVYLPTVQEQGLMNSMDETSFGELASLLRSNGGSDVGQILLRVTLTGESTSPVRITNVGAHNLTRTAPTTGTLFAVSSQGGAPTEQAVLDLDKTLPMPELVAPDGSSRPYFAVRTIQLKRHEQQVFVLTITSNRHSDMFDVEFDYMVSNQLRHLTLDNDGRHFHLTGYNCSGQSGIASYVKTYELTQGPSSLQLTPGPTPERTDVGTYKAC